MKVAVTSMECVIADINTNLSRANTYVMEAAQKGASLIVLPEYFTTGFSVDPMLRSAVMKSITIEETLSKWARLYSITIAGAYLYYDEMMDECFNKFTMFFPTGEKYFHYKKKPIAIENYIYTEGDDEQWFDTPLGKIGIASGWEQISYDTVRRLCSKVDFVIGGACWWNFAFEDGDKIYKKLNPENKKLATNAPLQLAKLLGVSVLQSASVGEASGYAIGMDRLWCTREIESKAVAINGKGEYILEPQSEPGLFFVEIDLEHNKHRHISRKKEWTMKVSGLMRKYNEEITKTYRKSYYKWKKNSWKVKIDK